MAPAPFDPIRPIGGQLGRDLYVARSEQTERVLRRRGPGDDEPGRRRGQSQEEDPAADAEEEGVELVDPGTYDGRGRSDGPDASPNLDLSA